MVEQVTLSVSSAEQQLVGGGVARYERPAERLRDYITGYHLYRAPRGQLRSDWFLPGTANIRIAWYNKPITVTIGDRTFDPIPQAALFGPTMQALHARTRGGFMVGIGVSALGWSRLFTQSAATVADAIVPLDTMWPLEQVLALVHLLQSHDVALPVAPLLDAFLDLRFAAAKPEEALLARLAALVVDENIEGVSQIVGALGVGEVRVRRLAYRYFGFAPGHLLRRARFLRAIIPVAQSGAPTASRLIPQSYFDQSHFIREARRFLGMTPSQFASLEKPFLSASLELRPKILGAVTQALQPIGTLPSGN